jgi:hypothetical protein
LMQPFAATPTGRGEAAYTELPCGERAPAGPAPQAWARGAVVIPSARYGSSGYVVQRAGVGVGGCNGGRDGGAT